MSGRGGSKYDWIIEQARKYADARTPGCQTFRLCTRQGGCYDQLYVIVSYRPRVTRDGRTIWQSRGEVVSVIPSKVAAQITTLERGSAHNRSVLERGGL